MQCVTLNRKECHSVSSLREWGLYIDVERCSWLRYDKKKFPVDRQTGTQALLPYLRLSPRLDFYLSS